MAKKKKSTSLLQYMRWFTLLSMIAVFVFIPFNQRYISYKSSYNQARLVELADGYVVGRIYAGLDWFYSKSPKPLVAATASSGSLWAFSLLGIPFSDPLGVLSELTHAVVFPKTYLLGALIPLFLTLLLGRVFCAWLCPMTVLFAISSWIRRGFAMFHIPLMEIKLEPTTRIFVFVGGMLISMFSGAWVWHFLLPYIAFTQELFALVCFSGFSAGIYIVLVVFVLDIGLIPQQFCRTICPSGWFLSLIGSQPVFKLRVAKESCPKGCSQCQKACPEDLFPKEEILFSCHLCLKCVDQCPKQHIHLALNPVFTGSARPQPIEV